MKVLVVMEPTETGYSAYAPDVPGCIATGGSPAEVEQSMREALEFHLEGLGDLGMTPPEPRTYAKVLEISA